jgi:hypothetical protein
MTWNARTGPRSWGSGELARCVEQQQQHWRSCALCSETSSTAQAQQIVVQLSGSCARGVRLSLKLGYEEWVQIGKSRYNINPSTTPLGKSRDCPRARCVELSMSSCDSKGTDDTSTRHRGGGRACRSGCRCKQRPDWYYRFTLEGEAAPHPHAAD